MCRSKKNCIPTFDRWGLCTDCNHSMLSVHDKGCPKVKDGRIIDPFLHGKDKFKEEEFPPNWVTEYLKLPPRLDKTKSRVVKSTDGFEDAIKYANGVLKSIGDRENYLTRNKKAIDNENERLVKESSDGSSASYYELPKDAKELQDIISYKDMNSQIGEIFRACMRYGEVSHSPMKRDIKKIIFYAQEELKRLERYDQ